MSWLLTLAILVLTVQGFVLKERVEFLVAWNVVKKHRVDALEERLDTLEQR